MVRVVVAKGSCRSQSAVQIAYHERPVLGRERTDRTKPKRQLSSYPTDGTTKRPFRTVRRSCRIALSFTPDAVGIAPSVTAKLADLPPRSTEDLPAPHRAATTGDRLGT